jgi:hypothetical protein
MLWRASQPIFLLSFINQNIKSSYEDVRHSAIDAP